MILHPTLSYALRYLPIPPPSKQKLWVLGDAYYFAPTGEKSQQGIVVYHGIASSQRQGGKPSSMTIQQTRSDCQVHL